MNAIEKIKKTNDVYSFFTELFICLNNVNINLLNKEYQIFAENKAIIKRIDQYIDLLKIANINEFNLWKTKWIKILSENIDNEIGLCLFTLLKLDNILTVENYCRKNNIIEKRGPLNNYENQDAYMFISPPCGFYDESFKKRKIRKGRQLVEFDSVGLNNKLKNFDVILKTSLNDKVPKVLLYKKFGEVKDNISIGIIPIDNKPWFNVLKNDHYCQFCISYDKIDSLQYNLQICDILRKLDNNKTNIAFFPELAMNKETLKFVKNFILKEKLNYIKLIFLGSLWHNNSNEAYVLTGNGTIIDSYKKKKPYKMYCKEKDAYYIENIESSDSKLFFLDVDGLGRFNYTICFDYLNDDIAFSCSSVMKSNIMCISAYSNSITNMIKRAKNDAEMRGIITIICNSCAATKVDDVTSCIVKPLLSKINCNKIESDIFLQFNHCPNGCGVDKCTSCFQIKKIFKE